MYDISFHNKSYIIAELLVVDSESVHVELPVGVPGDGHVREVALVVRGVRPAQDQLSALRGRRVAAHIMPHSLTRAI